MKIIHKILHVLSQGLHKRLTAVENTKMQYFLFYFLSKIFKYEYMFLINLFIIVFSQAKFIYLQGMAELTIFKYACLQLFLLAMAGINA